MRPYLRASVLFCICAIFFTACTSSSRHQQNLHSTNDRQMTLGVVQKEISVGMSQAEVAEALGSPNIVTSDNTGKETWIYDKIATEASYSKSNSSIGAAGGAGGVAASTLLLGIISGSHSSESVASSTTQRTLTVSIKFDAEKKVDSFSYHTSRF